MDIGYRLQHVGERRGPFITDLKDAVERHKERTDGLVNPYNLREGHTWLWGPDRTRNEAYERIVQAMQNHDPGYGLVLRGRNNHDEVARNKQWGIWKVAQLEGHAIIQQALELLGLRYVWAGSSETNGLDCSGLTMDCIHDVTGILLPHQSNLQYHDNRVDTFQDVSRAKPGDLVFMHFGRVSDPHEADHVGFYLDKRDGAPYMLDTRSTSEPVAIRKIETWAVLAYGRIQEINGPLA